MEVEAAVEADGGGREIRGSAGNGRAFMTWDAAEARRARASQVQSEEESRKVDKRGHCWLLSSMRHSLKLCEQVIFPCTVRSTILEFAIHPLLPLSLSSRLLHTLQAYNTISLSTDISTAFDATRLSLEPSSASPSIPPPARRRNARKA